MKGSALERFAQEARVQLKEQVKAKLNLILKGDESVDIIENRKAINELNKALKEKGEESLVDEVAYTWFNRISALRYMDARGFNSTMIVSPAAGKTLPEILSDALSGVFNDALADKQKDKIQGLIDGSVASKNPQADIYRVLLVSSCNALNESLPLLFEKINDYTDLLLPDDLLSTESIITKTVNALSIEDCENSVEIIGWLYQYYISEKKDEVFASFKKGKKAGKDEIPAATQLFTPEWIVRYLVENSLGRLWMLNNPNSSLKEKMKYYIAPTEAEKDFIKLSSPEEIKILDPCCGSGHMLTYAFDLLFEIYNEYGYTDNDATESIIKNNLYGIEIDKRAGQLAYFALMMKARERSRRFFRKHVEPNVCILENVVFDQDELPKVYNLFENPTLTLMDLMKQFEHADILGSLITPAVSNIKSLKDTLKTEASDDIFAEENTLTDRAKKVLEMAEYLGKRYNIVITNPPYLAPSSSDPILQNFAKGQYPNSKEDVGIMFIERNFKLLAETGILAMITLHGWMFLSRTTGLRYLILSEKTIESLVHIGSRGFDSIGGEVVSTVAFIIKNRKEKLSSNYISLVSGKSESEKEQALLASIATNTGHYILKQDAFFSLPDYILSFWISSSMAKNFTNNKKIGDVIDTRVGLDTGNNDKYIRLWFEIDFSKIIFTANSSLDITGTKKWVPHTKGGEYRKWYGNLEYVLAFDKQNYEALLESGNHLPSRQFYFREGINWTRVSTKGFCVRFSPKGIVFNSGCPTAFTDGGELLYCLGLLNSNSVIQYAKALSPTINFQVGEINKIPFIYHSVKLVNDITNQNIGLSKLDWDSFETSWDFGRHSLLYVPRSDSVADGTIEDLIQDAKHAIQNGFSVRLSDMYEEYKDEVNTSFDALKHNEEELNRIFIDIYGLQDELTPEEDDSMVSVHRIFESKEEIPESMRKGQYALTKDDVVKSFISYTVGCMLGRYNPFKHGLAYAGGEWDESRFDSTYMPDDDNVIPMLDDSWFENDAERYFIRFLEVMYGKDTLNENLKFVENALGMSVRKYFAKYFYADHLKTYQKRPIYWMFSSPKGHFQTLVYMHRYNENTANVVLKYLREFRGKIQAQIKMAEDAGETKKAFEFQNIDKDLNDYEMNTLYPLAVQHITFDLDDGVKVNYQKLGKALKPIK